jgi:uncharacterized membrane protein
VTGTGDEQATMATDGPPGVADGPTARSMTASRSTPLPFTASPARAQPPALATSFLAAHVTLIAFSTAAMVTILNRPAGAWVQQEPAATVMRLGWRFSGPLYVLLGALAALAFLARAVGTRRALTLFVAAAGISLGVELIGTSTALPFGEYHYSSLLGYRVLGLVPFPIPVSWFYMLAGCLTIVSRRAAAADNAATKWRWAALAGSVLVAWDISMDPAMVRTAHWSWGAGQVFRNTGLPGWISTFFSGNTFYGMPLSNWLGWYLTGTIIARVMLGVVSPRLVAERLGRSRFFVLLYLVNGIMPVAICLRDGLWGAAALGATAMLVPGVVALAAPARPGAEETHPAPLRAHLA